MLTVFPRPESLGAGQCAVSNPKLNWKTSGGSAFRAAVAFVHGHSGCNDSISRYVFLG